LDIKLLQEFAVLAECLNFHAAADRLFITQPALSRHLASLEQELGAPLFTRTTTHVELTDIGKELLGNAANIVDEYGLMLAKVRMHRHEGSLRIGGFIRHSRVLPLLSHAMNRFQTKYPWVETHEDDLVVADHREPLLDDTFDVMLSPHLERPDDERLQYHDILHLRLMVWMTEGNPLAARVSVSLRELQDQALRFLSLGHPDAWHSWRTYILQLFAAEGLTPRVGPPTNVSLALSDTEYALVPSSATKSYGHGIVAVSLDEPHYVDLSLVHKRTLNNPAVPLFVAEVLEAQRELEKDDDEPSAEG